MASQNVAAPAPTRPRLQAINQDFADLEEQIRQAVQIIGLPQDWELVQDENARTSVTSRLVRARSEWVLRWTLDKLKDDGETGTRARASPVAWRLLDWMIHALPTSRCAPHLRDAGLLTILERTLADNFEQDITAQPASTGHGRGEENSESSETAQETQNLSRKRKRGSSGTSTPSKRSAVESPDLAKLFDATRTAIKTVVDKSTRETSGEMSIQAELMKTSLRTECAQAARVLKCWLIAVQKLLLLGMNPSHWEMQTWLDLSLVLEIWELRAVDSNSNSQSSTEQFAIECLVPALLLLDTLKQHSGVEKAIKILDGLMARHVFAPSRAAFLSGKDVEVTPENKSPPRAALLSSNLESLRAKLLQAAEIQDFGIAIPPLFYSLFNGVPYLLDLAIRSSPSRSSKGRISEQPWIQAVFVALAETTGCSLEAPEFATPEASIHALDKSLEVLRLHDLRVDAGILRDLFWFHSGVKYPLKKERNVHWSLVAALIQVDPGTFLPSPRPSTSAADDRPNDLVEFLFNQISASHFKDALAENGEDVDMDDCSRDTFSAETVLRRIVVPIMSAFARNRNLLGFIGAWDVQLSRNAPLARAALKEKKTVIWEDRTLGLALSELLESSLTRAQIKDLFHDHVGRVQPGDADVPAEMENIPRNRKALSSAVIIPVLLDAATADDLIAALRSDMYALFNSYTTRVKDDRHAPNSRLGLCWFTLCQLVAMLWPTELSGSPNLQQKLLYPLVEQATNDMSASRKELSERPMHSFARAAAMLFVLTACEHLRRAPNTSVIIRKSVRKTIKSLSTSKLEKREHQRMMEVFCAEYAPIIGYLDKETSQSLLVTLLVRISKLEETLGKDVGDALSQNIFSQGDVSLIGAYSAALLEVIGEDDNERLTTVAANAFFHAQPASLPRERREAVLDKLADVLLADPQNAAVLLGIMVHLMEVPNATAKLSSDGSAFVNIAAKLHGDDVESASTLQLLQSLVVSTLNHIIPNKSQTQNEQYLEKFKDKLASAMKKPKKCYPSRLALLRAAFASQKDAALLSPDEYVIFLGDCLQEPKVSGNISLHSCILDAFNEIAVASESSKDYFSAAQIRLRVHVGEHEGFQHWLLRADTDEGKAPPNLAQLHSTIAMFSLYQTPEQLIELTFRLFREEMSGKAQLNAMKCVRSALTRLPLNTKLELVNMLLYTKDSRDQIVGYRILAHLTSTLDDRHSGHAELKQQQHALLPKICFALGTSHDHAMFNALLDTINTILNSKPALTTQHSIECVLTALVKLSSRNSPALSPIHAPAIFARLCETSRLLLLLHRSRLGGRFHVFLPLLQNLLLCLFIPHPGRGSALPRWLKPLSTPKSPASSSSIPTPIRLTPTNASQYTHLLSTLCSPPESSVRRKPISSHHHHNDPSSHSHSTTTTTLNDPSKAARDYASKFAYPLLSSYCRYLLFGRLAPLVRAKLLPGIGEVLAMAEAGDRSSLEAMWAGLEGAEREVWKAVWEEWREGGR